MMGDLYVLDLIVMITILIECQSVEMVDLIIGSTLMSFLVDFLNHKFTRSSEYL